MRPPIAESFQNVLSLDEYIVLEGVQTYAALILHKYIFLTKIIVLALECEWGNEAFELRHIDSAAS